MLTRVSNRVGRAKGLVGGLGYSPQTSSWISRVDRVRGGDKLLYSIRPRDLGCLCARTLICYIIMSGVNTALNPYKVYG